MFLYKIALGGKGILNNVIKRYFNIVSFAWMIQY